MGALTVRSTPGIWLLDYHVGGRVFRYATERCSVTDAAGTTYLYDEGLSDLELGMVRTLGERRIGIEVNSPEDWAIHIARGTGLDQRRAVLRYWRSGTVLERADVVAVGLTEGVAVSDGGEALSFEIVDDLAARALTLPPPSAVVGDDTWPSGRAGYELPDDSVGKLYPVLIGYPGDHPKRGASVDLAEPAFPAALVEEQTVGDSAERWLVAHGRIEAAQASLWLDEGSGLESSDQATAVTTDLLGQTLTYVEVGNLAPTSTEVWAGLRKASGWGGGILSPYTGDVLRGAGEVARYILDYFAPTVTLDKGRMAAAQAWLDRFQVDGVILGENAVTWLDERVLRHLPVMGVDGPRGFYLAPMRWDAQARHAVAHLDADTGRVDLDGEIGTWDEPVFNHFVLDYRPRRMGAEYASRRTLTSIDGDLTAAITTGANLPPFTTSLPWIATTERDYRVWGSVLCRGSQARHGVRQMDTIQHMACWDDHTAALILHYLAARYAVPKRQARYVGGAELDGLLPGDVVTVTDTANYLSSAVALVVERTVSAADVALDLVLLGVEGRRVT